MNIANKAAQAVTLGFTGITSAIFYTLLIFLPVGWIMNIFNVAEVLSTGEIDVEGALHIVGVVVFPLGAIMGLFF